MYTLLLPNTLFSIKTKNESILCQKIVCSDIHFNSNMGDVSSDDSVVVIGDYGDPFVGIEDPFTKLAKSRTVITGVDTDATVNATKARHIGTIDDATVIKLLLRKFYRKFK